MTKRDALEFAILKQVLLRGTVSFEDLMRTCSGHTWNQLFAAVDGLSRRGAITLRRIDRCTYLVSLGPQCSGRQATSSVGDASFANLHS